MVAVADKRGGLALYAVASGTHAAVLVRRLAGPPHDVVSAVSLSTGPSPTVCAIWRPAAAGSKATSELRCYAPGATMGRVVRRDVNDGELGLRADGQALAWTEGGQYLVIADLADGVATVRSRMLYADQAPEYNYPESLDELDWIGPRTLVGTAGGDSDESIGLCVIDLDHPRSPEHTGFGRCLHPTGAEGDKGYAHFEQAALVSPGEVVVVERGPGCCVENPGVPAARAVRLRLSDGAVVAVIATPRAGRDVVDVSGGERGVLYITGVEGEELTDVAVSLRWAGEAHGAPLTGLPADLTLAAAQP
jgi:hypothetical protein